MSALNAEIVRRAMAIYMARAYGGVPPAAVRARLERLASAADDDFFSCEVLERDPKDAPTRYSIRLGSRFYPHMKLTIERAPDGGSFLLKADTHDKHCCPADTSCEYAAFRELMDRNQKLAQEIELAWAEERLPTFKTYLRDDLARRRESAAKRLG